MDMKQSKRKTIRQERKKVLLILVVNSFPLPYVYELNNIWKDLVENIDTITTNSEADLEN